MSFTSLAFWSFFAVVFVLHWLAKEKRWQNLILLVASYVFYGWIQPWLALMLGISTVLDFALAKQMKAKPSRTKLWLWLTLLLNLGVLAFFKYFNFFSADLARVLTSLGLSADFLLTKILLPAGLSFYTLKKLGYMLDVSRGTLQPTHSFVDFALYVSFFPQIVAGPIDRPQKLLPQIETTRTWKAENLYSAWHLILMGLFKKIVIAGTIGSITGRIFHLEQPTLLLAITGALGFTLQILADFSAYTDLSRGVAFLLGFNTTENFKSPYLSLTPTDFWNRWHITLSTWLRDYVFFPVRRWLASRKSPTPAWLVQATPPFVTMLISGLWHGAGWTYLAWGALYGILIVVYQALGIGGSWKPKNLLQTLCAWLIMFAFIVFGWMLFAAPSITWVGTAFSNSFLGTREQQAVALIGLTTATTYSLPLIADLLLERYTKDDSVIRSFYHAAVTASIFIFLNSNTSDFIYFQF